MTCHIRARYRGQADRLSAYLAQHDVTLPLKTLHDAIAALHGADNWTTLVGPPKPTLLQRLLGHKTWPNTVPRLEDFPLTTNPKMVRLGAMFSKPKVVDTEYSWLRRHVLVCGPVGMGATSFLEVLLTQHVLAGGGALVFDTFDSSDTAASMRKSLQYSGRIADGTFLTIADRAQAALDWSHILRTNGVVYAPSDAMRNAPSTDDAQLMAQLAKAIAERSVQPTQPQLPFLVLIGRGSTALCNSSASLFAQARAKNICLIVETPDLSNWRKNEQALAEAVLANTFTKVFLRPTTDTELAAVETFIESQVAPPSNEDAPKQATIRDQLRKMSFGEALLLRFSHLEHLKLYMVDHRP